jgi:mRNA interferase HigB
MRVGRSHLDARHTEPDFAFWIHSSGFIVLDRESHFGTILKAMRVIAVTTLRAFWARHPDAEQPLKAWYEEVLNATWAQPADIKAHYRSASILKNRRVVFNIKGNDYRLIVAVAYRLQIVYVKFVGTHAEYDAIDAATVELA